MRAPHRRRPRCMATRPCQRTGPPPNLPRSALSALNTPRARPHPAAPDALPAPGDREFRHQGGWHLREHHHPGATSRSVLETPARSRGSCAGQLLIAVSPPQPDRCPAVIIARFKVGSADSAQRAFGVQTPSRKFRRHHEYTDTRARREVVTTDSPNRHRTGCGQIPTAPAPSTVATYCRRRGSPTPQIPLPEDVTPVTEWSANQPCNAGRQPTCHSPLARVGRSITAPKSVLTGCNPKSAASRLLFNTRQPKPPPLVRILPGNRQIAPSPTAPIPGPYW